MTLAALALAASACLMRSQVAQALVDRGDNYFGYGAPHAAQVYYERAIALDGSNSIAVDRYIFLMMQKHTPAAARRAVQVATTYLTGHRDNAVIFADRALCRLVLRDYPGARRDFQRARALTPNQPVYGAAIRTLSHKSVARL